MASGQTDTQADAKDKQVGKSDDKCIGNRKVRTIILCLLIFIFYVFAFGFMFENQDIWATLYDACSPCDSLISDPYTMWNFIVSGMIITMFGCIVTIILFFIPGCDNKIGRIPGLILILGSVLYIIGWIWWIDYAKYNLFMYDNELFPLTDDQKEQIDARLLVWFGEALLPSATAILLGLDVLLHFFERETFRLFTNLGLLAIVSILIMPGYYILGGDYEGVEVIGTGYLIVFIVCVVYIILYILTICTCDCKDRCIVRVLLGGGLLLGGVITALGYYIYAGDVGGSAAGTSDGLGDDTYESKMIAYYVGYTILAGGLLSAWALDVTFDDLKNSRQEKKK